MAWLGRLGRLGGVGWRNGVWQQVLGGGRRSGKEEGEVMYCPVLSPEGGRKQHLLIRMLTDN